ncbi:MAG: Zn-ribbon domain-containing protein [Candidatus Altiarchaeota archaeon]|nr:Zn-ribbon domain-containing protein [Candidatus Altiarchaeota archaeon]
MPHKCARCSSIYEDGSTQLKEGCGCGSKVFLYLRSDYAGTKEQTIQVLKEKEISQKDLEWLDEEFTDKLKRQGRTTISLDLENVLRVDEGKFRLDLQSLMRGEPVVIKAEEGVYYIDIAYAMKKKRGSTR